MTPKHAATKLRIVVLHDGCAQGRTKQNSQHRKTLLSCEELSIELRAPVAAFGANSANVDAMRCAARDHSWWGSHLTIFGMIDGDCRLNELVARRNESRTG